MVSVYHLHTSYTNLTAYLLIILTSSPFHQDDAGPPFLDDEPGVKYHDGSGAWPVLLEDGTCANPVKEACALRDDAKTAYLEGESYLYLYSYLCLLQ